MTMQVDLWTLLTFLIGLLLTFLACIFGFAKVLGAQIDKRLEERFKAQEQARETGAKALREAIDTYAEEGKRTAEQVAALERDFLEWKAELPIYYVRRDDYIRGQSVIEAKLDALYNKLEVVQLKGATHG
ncbi:hypothetical protein [Oryzomicrobium sp.]|uniref:hypothetical protein n=1 Tax=Oryzomicrobium sp. TaxID=1911578 RepID=UPI002FDF450B